MTFAHPHLLWLLAAVVGLALCSGWWARRARARAASVGAGHGEHAASVGRKRESLRAALLWSGLAAAVLALAGPRWGATDETRAASGADLLVAIDCSRSMLATDIYPTRLDAARRKIKELVARSPEMRVALLPFAGVSALRCPLTGDHQVVGELLDDCTPDLFPAESGLQGTAIGAAVRDGLGVLGRQVERGQAILVLSDGSDEDEPSVTSAVDAARAAGVPVYGLFLGDAERTSKIVIDGREEIMASSRETLDRFIPTGGITIQAVAGDADVQALVEHLTAHLARRPWEERRRVVASERFRWPLLPAILLVAMGMVLPTRRREG